MRLSSHHCRSSLGKEKQVKTPEQVGDSYLWLHGELVLRNKSMVEDVMRASERRTSLSRVLPDILQP
jgi:hypothetical protein